MRFNQFTKWILFLAFLGGFQKAIADGEGRIVTANGQVTVNGAPAKVGDSVPVGAKIETANGASASVIFGTDNVVKVSSGTLMSVEPAKMGSTTLVLVRGQVDGVKKTGTEAKTNIVVKTDKAVFTLNSGRYSVDNNSSGSGETRFVAVDGDASLQYSQKTDLKKAGSTIALKQGSVVDLVPRPSPSNMGSSEVVSSDIKTLPVSEALNLRPSQKDQPSMEQMAKNLTASIINLRNETSPAASTRTPASVGSTAPSMNEVVGSTGPAVSLPTLPRDPMQTVPGRGNAAVSVIFQP